MEAQMTQLNGRNRAANWNRFRAVWRHWAAASSLTMVMTLVITTLLLTPRPAAAAIDCNASSWSVATATELNEAIACFNAKPSGSYTITLTGDINLTASSTSINNATPGAILLIEGAGFTVNGGGISGVKHFNILNGDITMQKITLTGGYGTGNLGGAIYNQSTLTLTNSSVSGNSALYGGGIYNVGTLNLKNSVINNNTGLGIGGGIYNPGTLSIIGSTISNNRVDNNGFDSGGILNSGTLTLTQSTVSGNWTPAYGGGINNTNLLIIENSTISGNTALLGGGGVNIGTSGLTGVLNSTISHNSATSGGGIRNEGIDFNIYNSIIANSTSGGDCVSPGTISHALSNLVEDNSCGFTGGSDPNLGPLQDNGGPTFTHALLPGSPAINTGIISYINEIVDQRGVRRPQGGTADKGAFEVYDCSAQSWQVGNSGELDAAITCFNAATNAGSYILNLTQNISLSNSSTGINNATPDVELVLEGNNFMVDGQRISGVRPFAIAASTTVTMRNITITGGETTVFGYGGGIFNQGTLTLINGVIHNNWADDGGAGISNSGTLTITNSTIRDNEAFNVGGGIVNSDTLFITNSTISGNIVGNSGGGIYNSGEIHLTNSTISGNQGDGIITWGSGNGALTIINSTISGNSGPGIYNVNDPAITISNSILANNEFDCQSSYGATADSSNNLIESSGDNACGLTNGTNGNIVGADPLLGPLQDNGGPTFTHALLPGSPAINAGDSTETTDQRGVARPQGSADDIGAFEVDVVYDCNTQPWLVSDENDLDEAIACLNAQTSTADYTISLTQNIGLTTSSTAIENTTVGINLTIQGNGFTVDGQGIAAVRPFSIDAGNVTMQNITITGGNVPAYYGGGIINNGTLAIYNSTISGNAAADGGGIENYGSLTILNSTISGNTAVGFGGGIDNWRGTLTLSSSTVNENAAQNGGGIYNSPDASLLLRNSIVANSLSGGDCVSDVTVTDGGYNLIQNSGVSGCGFVNSLNNNIVGQDPLLGPLQDNGGPTFTHALLPGSPAINAGNTTLAFDQRGVPRPVGPADDIGAVEQQFVIFLPAIIR